MTVLLILAAAAAASSVAPGQEALETGLSGALRGCEEWVLNPASWATGLKPFVDKVALEGRIGLVDHVDEVNLPPKSLRRGSHFWRINATETAGYILVVSDQLPMCHITGGGAADLQPVAEAVIASAEFGRSWEKLESEGREDMVSTRFRNRTEPALELILSRARFAGGARDRVQLIATALYKPTK